MITTAPEVRSVRERARLRTLATRGTSFADGLLALALLVVAWYVASTWTGTIPVPHEVAEACVDVLTDATSYDDLGATLRRIVTAFILAFGIGATGGALIGVSPLARSFLRPWVVAGMSAPMPVVVIVAVLIIGIGERSAVISMTVSVAPFIATIVGDAVAGHDRQLVQLSSVFRVSRFEQLRHVLVPQVAPALIAASRTGFSLCWKLVVVVEAIASADGVGAQMQRDFKLLQVDRMIAWALVFTVFMKVVDAIAFESGQRRSLRWRRGDVAARPHN